MNPDIKVTLETQPAGTEGDNLMKTKLATGEMADVFAYNSGSLFQALNPDQNLVPLTDEAWVADLPDEFKSVVSTDKGTVRRADRHLPAGAVLYNKKVYADLGLKVPTTWAEFKANNEKIKADGKVDPDPADLRRDLDLAAVRARRLRQRGRPGSGVGRRSTPPTSASTSTSRPCRASRTSRTRSTPATSTRTSPRPSTTTASRPWPPARRPTTRC